MHKQVPVTNIHIFDIYIYNSSCIDAIEDKKIKSKLRLLTNTILLIDCNH